MAKKSKIVRELKLVKNIQKYATLRAELKEIIKDPKASFEEKEVAVARLDGLPKSLQVIGVIPPLAFDDAVELYDDWVIVTL